MSCKIMDYKLGAEYIDLGKFLDKLQKTTVSLVNTLFKGNITCINFKEELSNLISLVDKIEPRLSDEEINNKKRGIYGIAFVEVTKKGLGDKCDNLAKYLDEKIKVLGAKTDINCNNLRNLLYT